MNPLLLFITFLSIAVLAIAGEANTCYVTDDGHLFKETGIHVFLMDPQKAEAAKTMPECQPAKDFPEGNWGEVQGGIQLSLRFAKQTFTNGEPISAVLLLRNVTNKNVEYSTFPVGYFDGPIGFHVTSGEGQIMSQHRFSIGVINSSSIAGISPGTQVKFVERLDKRFDLTNGTYSIQAVTRVGALTTTITVENGKPIFHPPDPAEIKSVKSAAVTIEIGSAPTK